MKKIMGCGGLKIGVYQTSVALILAWLQLSHSNQVAKPATGWHLIQSCGLSVKFLWGPAANVKRHMLISTLLSHFGVLFTNLIFFFQIGSPLSFALHPLSQVSFSPRRAAPTAAAEKVLPGEPSFFFFLLTMHSRPVTKTMSYHSNRHGRCTSGIHLKTF